METTKARDFAYAWVLSDDLLDGWPRVLMVFVLHVSVSHGLYFKSDIAIFVQYASGLWK